jgi:hypothetical protein
MGSDSSRPDFIGDEHEGSSICDVGGGRWVLKELKALGISHALPTTV